MKGPPPPGPPSRSGASGPAPARSERVRFAGIAALLFVVTLLAYAPALAAGFVWDDNGFVLRPDLHSPGGLGRIWFDLTATEQYYPLLHTAFWTEHLLWGDAAGGYHLANVLLHATAACLFARLLFRLGAREEVAWLAAFLFALHPVAVESVAWISEQKNTLSMVFYLLAALAYVDGEDTRGTPEGGRWGRGYGRATAWFILALLSKTVTATLPAALLVVAWWRRGRLSWRRDVVPLLPWFGLGAAAGLFSGWVERTYIGAQGAAFDLTLAQRALVAGREVWFYLGKLLWPANLIFIYPRWKVDAAAAGQWLFPAGVLLLVGALWRARRRSRAPLAALLLFIGTLFPTLGFFNVYAFIFSYVADHWQYLATLGVIALAAAGWGRLPRRPARAVAVAVLAILAVLTWRQCRNYDNAETFYRAILARNPDCWLAYSNLGNVLAGSGRTAAAVPEYEAALRLVPDSPGIHYDLGDALVHLGRLPEGMAEYRTAIRLKPDDGLAQARLAAALVTTGRPAEAIPHFAEAVRLLPGDVEAELTLGSLLGQAGRLPEAIARLQDAVGKRPDLPEARNNLGNALAAAGRLPEAIAQYREAVRLRPAYREARYNLSIALRNDGEMAEAVRQYRLATGP
jgi:tetratricopeptide (TPR) repeat protein